MKRSISAVATVLAFAPLSAQAQTGVYPYTRAYYERGTLIASEQISGVVLDRYRGAFYSKNERNWQSDIISAWARNITGAPLCLMVTFKAYGTSLDWASEWGNGQIFYLKKDETIRNFAGITSTEQRFGMSEANVRSWKPLGKKNCGTKPPGGM